MRNIFNLISSLIVAVIISILFVLLVNFLISNWLYELLVVLTSIATFGVFIVSWAYTHDAIKELRK